jgi:hypothetical protein
MFASPALGRKSVKNISLKGHQIISLPQAGSGIVKKVLVRHMLQMLNLSHITSKFALLPSLFYAQVIFHTKYVDMFVIHHILLCLASVALITKKLKANE